MTLPSLISAELRDLCSFKGQRKRDHEWSSWSACFRLCSFWQAHGLVLGVHMWFSFVGLFVLNDAIMLVLWCAHLTRPNYMPKNSLSSMREAGLKETLSAEGWGRGAAGFLEHTHPSPRYLTKHVSSAMKGLRGCYRSLYH